MPYKQKLMKGGRNKPGTNRRVLNAIAQAIIIMTTKQKLPILVPRPNAKAIPPKNWLQPPKNPHK